MSNEIIIRKIDIHYSGGSKEVNWLIFESGNIQHPLLCISNSEMKAIISQYENIIKQEKRK